MGVIVGKTRDGGNYFGDRPMAEPLYPWLYGNGWRIGPFTSNDEDRRRAEETWAQIQAEQGQEEVPDVMPAIGYPGAAAGVAASPQSLPPDRPMPTDPQGESWWDWITGGEAGREQMYDYARRQGIHQNEMPQQALPDTAPVPTPNPSMVPPVVPEEIEAAPDTQQDIGTLKTALKEYFPELNKEPSQQQIAADAEADRQRKRTGLLAQLAFFSGITSGAGGPWKDVGKGLAAAGQIYDEGYERYHRTLQDNADREMKTRASEYDREVQMTNAAIKLYTAKKPQNDDMEKRRKERIDYFKASKPDPLGDPEAFAAWRRRFELYLETGEIMPEDIEDVSD